MKFIRRLLNRSTNELAEAEPRIKDFKPIDMSRYPDSGQTGFIFHIQVEGEAHLMAARLTDEFNKSIPGMESAQSTPAVKGSGMVQVRVPATYAPQVREVLTRLKQQSAPDVATGRTELSLLSVIEGVSDKTEENRRTTDQTHHFAVELDGSRVREGQLQELAAQMKKLMETPAMKDALNGVATGKVRWVPGTKTLLVEVTRPLATSDLDAIGKAIGALQGSDRGKAAW
jgi:hypothetical protein